MAGLNDVFSEIRTELLRFVTARTGSAAESEDIVQDVWLRLQTMSSGPIGNPRGYIYRTAQNLILDRVRDRRRREQRESDWAAGQHQEIGGELADIRPGPAAEVIEREEAADLAAAIASLPEKAGRVFRLHKLEGLSHVEVAALLGISRSGVEKHMAVAMARLRQALMG